MPRVSPRWLIIVGTGLTFIAFQWFARLGGSEAEYYAAWCVYMLGYFLSGPIRTRSFFRSGFKKRRGRAMGITYVGGAVVGSMGNKLNPGLVTFLPYHGRAQDLRDSCCCSPGRWRFSFFGTNQKTSARYRTASPSTVPVVVCAEPTVTLLRMRIASGCC